MKYLLTIVFLCIFALANAQERVYLETQAYSYSYQLADNSWKDWCDWIPCDLTVTMDLKNNLITVDNKKDDVFRIIKYQDQTTNSDGQKIVPFMCRDKDNGICMITLVIGKYSAMHIEYSDAKVQYLFKNK